MKAATIADFNKFTQFHISIHAAREGGDRRNTYNLPTMKISIHAAREGGDGDGLGSITFNIISIHAAREGGDCGNE